MTAHDVSWSIHLPCGRCGSTSETLDCVPVNSVWTGKDSRTFTVTGITTINGKPNVKYETSWPGRDDRGVGIADLDYFLAHCTEVTR